MSAPAPRAPAPSGSASGASRASAAFAALALAVLVGSSSAILVRLAQGAGVESLAIAAWRLTLASALLVGLAVFRRRSPWRMLAAGVDRRLATLAGVLLGLHFALWISSLAFTSVASSVALVSSTPVWVALASVLLLRERLVLLTWLGIAVSLAGIGLILRADAVAGPAALAASPAALAAVRVVELATPALLPDRAMGGNLLALGGAIAFGAYLLIGRRLAGRVPIADYVTVVYGVAAVGLLAAAGLAGAPLGGYPAVGWLALAGLALGPQLLAHTVYNWAVGRLSPTFVALATLGEPLGAAALAAAILAEWPTPAQAVALAVLLTGIAVAAVGERLDR